MDRDSIANGMSTDQDPFDSSGAIQGRGQQRGITLDCDSSPTQLDGSCYNIVRYISEDTRDEHEWLDACLVALIDSAAIFSVSTPPSNPEGCCPDLKCSMSIPCGNLRLLRALQQRLGCGVIAVNPRTGEYRFTVAS